MLVGPTAAGKSLAAALVRRYAAEGRRAEVVNADSMLVYRGMDIGTAKPSEAERAEIVVITWLICWTSAKPRRWRSSSSWPEARSTTAGLVTSSRSWSADPPCTSERLSTTSSSRERIRRCERGWSASVTQGAERLHQRLSDADPLAATRILPGNARRVIRALEVIELTGRSFSAVLPERRYRLLMSCRSASLSTGRRSTLGLPPAWTQCGLQASSRKYAGSPRRASVTASPPRARSDIGKCCVTSTGRSVRQKLAI